MAMMKEITSKDEMHKVGRLALYAVSAVVGIAAANLVNAKTTSSKYVNWINIGSGAVALLLATMTLKSKSSWSGPVRLALGTYGVVAILRGVLSVVSPSARTQLTAVSQGVI